MASHQGVDLFESCAYSGYSIGTNQEIYLDQNILLLKFLGVYSLNWWLGETPKK